MLNRTNILIVDDEKNKAQVVKLILEKQGYTVTIVGSGKTAVELFYAQNPSLVILDLMLPDISGEKVCQEIRKSSRVPVIIASAKTDEYSILYSFQLGADDYVTKPFSPREMVARVVTLLNRTEYLSSYSSKYFSFNNGDLTVDLDRLLVIKNNRLVSLTQAEFSLLTIMIKYPYKVFTRDELMNLALKSAYDVGVRVIDTHIKNLRRKIEFDLKNPKYLLTVNGVGYKFGGLN